MERRETVFYPDMPDHPSTKQMIDYLSFHFRYYTMNSWNQVKSYANRVKLHDLKIPEKHMDDALGIVCGDISCQEYECIVEAVKHAFYMETGYAMDFNGRSGGHLVLYDTLVDERGSVRVRVGRSPATDPERLENLSEESLKQEYDLVRAFDLACENLRRSFTDLLENGETVEKTKEIVQTVTTRTFVVRKNDTEETS